MNIEEAEDLRLRKTKGVDHRARFKLNIWSQLNNKLHPDRPLADFLARRCSDSAVDVAADSPHRPIANDCKCCANIHPRSEASVRVTVAVYALVEKAHPKDFSILNECLSDRHARPDLHRAARHQLPAHPLIKLANRKNQSVFLVKKAWGIWKLEGIMLDLRNLGKCSQ